MKMMDRLDFELNLLYLLNIYIYEYFYYLLLKVLNIIIIILTKIVVFKIIASF